MKARYHALKAEFGENFLDEMANRKREWRATGKDRERHRKYKKPLRGRLVRRARMRGRKAGIEATIKYGDIHWPARCPVLGIVLDYDSVGSARNPRAPNLPSLDRWDNMKGYVAGNVFVISLRANILKSNATLDEISAIYKYMKRRPRGRTCSVKDYGLTGE
jgi:hypothetical protein